MQHGVVSRRQLLDLGYSSAAIRHRLANGRLHVIYRGVYAVGRPELTPEGRWMAAVLACGDGAAISHQSAATLWELRTFPIDPVHVTIPSDRRCSRAGIVVHERSACRTTRRSGIPVTSLGDTLIDLAHNLKTNQLEAAINEADKLDLIHPAALHESARQAGRRGAALRRILDRQTFTLRSRLLLPRTRARGRV